MMYVPPSNAPTSVACVESYRRLALDTVRSQENSNLRTVRVRTRSAWESCTSLLGVTSTFGVIASSGHPMSLRTASTAAFALVRRSHRCV